MTMPGVARAVRRRKFSEAYRHTHVYAWRRVFKAARNFRRALVAEIREAFRPASAIQKSEFPFKCHLCELEITSAEDRMEWHGLGNCVEICDDCLGTGLDESQPDPEAAGLKCPMCKGRGWFHFLALEGGARGVIVSGEKPSDILKFPDRPIIPRKDARFED